MPPVQKPQFVFPFCNDITSSEFGGKPPVDPRREGYFCYLSHMIRTRPHWLPFLLFASFIVIPSCATGPPPGPSPEQIAGQQAKIVVVAPLNIVSSLPPELEGSTKMVSAALVEHLEAHGKTVHVIGFRSGRELWKDSIKEVRSSGGKQSFENAARVYVRRIGEQVEFDVLIVPSIFIQNAKMRSRTVRWDGAEQTMPIEGGINSKRANLYQGNAGTLNVRAASLFIHVLGRDGNSIQTKRSGLEIVQHLEWRVERKGGYSGTEEVSQELVNDTPAIEDIEMVRAGVAAALSPFLSEEVPGPTQTSPEGDPVPIETSDANPS
jgi:hypothetical protein